MTWPVNSVIGSAILNAIDNDVFAEMDRQNALQGGPDRTLASALYHVVLSEEVGEVAEAILHRDLDQEYHELIHVAAVAMQAALSIRLRQAGKPVGEDAW
jgi:NTP pyrophosphatase (non-canonical NTP hydrolase)